MLLDHTLSFISYSRLKVSSLLTVESIHVSIRAGRPLLHLGLPPADFPAAAAASFEHHSMSFDPLSNTTPSTPEPLASTPNLSPLARRQPLPGQQQTQYRAQPLPPAPERSHWSREDERPLRSDSREDRRNEGSPRAGGGGGGGGTMQPRSPQISPSFERERQTQREAVGESYHSSSAPSAQGGNYSGNNGGRNEQVRGNPGAGGVGLPADGYVRIRITGLEKNRRDVWIKFNAEVSRVAY